MSLPLLVAGLVALVAALLLYRSIRVADPGDFRTIEASLLREAAATARFFARARFAAIGILVGTLGLAIAWAAGASGHRIVLLFPAVAFTALLLARYGVHLRCLVESRPTGRGHGLRGAASFAFLAVGILLFACPLVFPCPLP